MTYQLKVVEGPIVLVAVTHTHPPVGVIEGIITLVAEYTCTHTINTYIVSVNLAQPANQQSIHHSVPKRQNRIRSRLNHQLKETAGSRSVTDRWADGSGAVSLVATAFNSVAIP